MKMPEVKGVGVGLRHRHFAEVLREKPGVPWFEVHSENFFKRGSAACAYLEDIRKNYPISVHGVGLSLGSADGLDKEHLQQLRALIEWIKPALISEHLSWSAIDKKHVCDLLPLPYTKESLEVICDNIKHAQDFLGRKILVENPSSYLLFADQEMKEWEFVKKVAEISGCGILLDVNNIFVSTSNTGVDAEKYIAEIPAAIIGEIHLAGYSVEKIEGQEFYIDTHGARVFDSVWELYEKLVTRFSSVPPTLIEWDTNVPEISVLQEEARKAERIIKNKMKKAA